MFVTPNHFLSEQQNRKLVVVAVLTVCERKLLYLSHLTKGAT